ncbi:unnamed protein product [Vitrella brassicaformis CCMP3155]|uniref:DUF7630 domain-containing protein n=4 Tax=Vitrella brassicaformis TaxID=1169539 RepID=A0A0G4EI11_VITBC|nr:unnamed protein product [Vitrella brassicaformis CCMP3155]|eukprot:CEL96613.1 unnamed protein product [Vitrella brassicaformis CCMP3155]
MAGSASLVTLSFTLLAAALLSTVRGEPPSSCRGCDEDREPLKRLYDSLSQEEGNDPDEVGPWNSSARFCDMWTGIRCGGFAGRTYGLHLSGRGLTGRIPESVGLLKHAKVIDLSKNRFTGPIPSLLPNLCSQDLESPTERLILEQNNLTGPIPVEVSNCRRLVELDLESNRLDGTLPPGLCHLTRLIELDVKRNYFSGAVPLCIGGGTYDGVHYEGMTKLIEVELQNNRLSGSLPPGVGNFTQAAIINFRSNRLSGRLPDTFQRIRDGVEVRLHDNNFDPYLPTSLAMYMQQFPKEVTIDAKVFACPGGNVPHSPERWEALDVTISAKTSEWREVICRRCPAGTQVDDAGWQCIPCPSGTYNELDPRAPLYALSQACRPCEAGTYNNMQGAIKCKLCRPGEYNIHAGLDYCQTCPTGTYAGAHGSTRCQDCPSGALCTTPAQKAIPEARPSFYSLKLKHMPERKDILILEDDLPGAGFIPLLPTTSGTSNDTTRLVDREGPAVKGLLFIPCPIPADCEGSNQCHERSEGLLCARCQAGYTRPIGATTCVGCPSMTWIGVKLVLWLLVFSALVVWMVRLNLSEGLRPYQTTQNVIWKILTTWLQLNWTAFSFSLRGPHALTNNPILVWLKQTSDFMEDFIYPITFLTMDCILPRSMAPYHFWLLIALIFPFAALLCVYICVLFSTWLQKRRHKHTDPEDEWKESLLTLAPPHTAPKGKGGSSTASLRPSQTKSEEGIASRLAASLADLERGEGESRKPRRALSHDNMLPATGNINRTQMVMSSIDRVTTDLVGSRAAKGGGGAWKKVWERFRSWRHGVWIPFAHVKSEERASIYRQTFHSFIVVVWLAHVLLNKTFIINLQCKQYDVPRLAADPNALCGGDDPEGHPPYYWLSIGGIWLYTFGIPLWLYLVMRGSRRRLYDDRVRQTLGFLYNGYEPTFYWYETFAMLRKVSVDLPLVVPDLGEAQRLGLLMFLAIFFLAVHVNRKPYDNRSYRLMDQLESFSLWNFMGLLMVSFFSSTLETELDIEALVQIVLLAVALGFQLVFLLWAAVAFLRPWILIAMERSERRKQKTIKEGRREEPRDPKRRSVVARVLRKMSCFRWVRQLAMLDQHKVKLKRSAFGQVPRAVDRGGLDEKEGGSGGNGSGNGSGSGSGGSRCSTGLIDELYSIGCVLDLSNLTEKERRGLVDVVMEATLPQFHMRSMEFDIQMVQSALVRPFIRRAVGQCLNEAHEHLGAIIPTELIHSTATVSTATPRTTPRTPPCHSLHQQRYNKPQQRLSRSHSHPPTPPNENGASPRMGGMPPPSVSKSFKMLLRRGTSKLDKDKDRDREREGPSSVEDSMASLPAGGRLRRACRQVLWLVRIGKAIRQLAEDARREAVSVEMTVEEYQEEIMLQDILRTCLHAQQRCDTYVSQDTAATAAGNGGNASFGPKHVSCLYPS